MTYTGKKLLEDLRARAPGENPQDIDAFRREAMKAIVGSSAEFVDCPSAVVLVDADKFRKDNLVEIIVPSEIIPEEPSPYSDFSSWFLGTFSKVGMSVDRSEYNDLINGIGLWTGVVSYIRNTKDDSKLMKNTGVSRDELVSRCLKSFGPGWLYIVARFDENDTRRICLIDTFHMPPFPHLIN